MRKFAKAFEKFISHRDTAVFMKEINELLEQAKSSELDKDDLYELNKHYRYQGQKLSPLSIIIKMASTISDSLGLIDSFIQMGTQINIDYGYHGDRHPDRPLPPLIQAIQLSIAEEKTGTNFDLYTDICKLLLKNNASVNKIGDNMSPLLACYNPKVEKIVPKQEEKVGTTDEIREFALRKRNPIIFKELLSHKSIDVFEFDILPHIELGWRKSKTGGKSYGSYGFQLLNLVDIQLTLYPDTTTHHDFFEPLFEKFCQQKDAIISELDKPVPQYSTQDELDKSFQSGLLFSAVTKFPDSKIKSIAKRIAENDEIYVDDLVRPVLIDRVKEFQSLAGMYPVPTQYFGSRDKVLMEGLLYHAYHVYPLIFGKSDLYTGPVRSISHNGRTVSAGVMQDFTYKVRNYSFIEMFNKMTEAEKRRIGEDAEVRPRLQTGRGGGKSEDYNIDDYDDSGKPKKKLIKQHYTQSFDFKEDKVVTFDPKHRTPVAIYHNEMLCFTTKPIAILSVYGVEKTVEKEGSLKDHEFIIGIHEEFANLRDLQRQKHYFYLTGEHIPIVKVISTNNHPILVETTDFKALTNIFTKTKDQKELLNYASLLADEKKWGKKIQKYIIQFYNEGLDKLLKDKQNYLLLWAINMGFMDSAQQMLANGAKVDLKLANTLGILDDVLKKGYLDEVKYLLSLGCTPKDPGLISAVKKQFGVHALDKSEKNSYVEPLTQSPVVKSM